MSWLDNKAVVFSGNEKYNLRVRVEEIIGICFLPHSSLFLLFRDSKHSAMLKLTYVSIVIRSSERANFFMSKTKSWIKGDPLLSFLNEK